jgi:hypothetical protein
MNLDFAESSAVDSTQRTECAFFGGGTWEIPSFVPSRRVSGDPQESCWDKDDSDGCECTCRMVPFSNSDSDNSPPNPAFFGQQSSPAGKITLKTLGSCQPTIDRLLGNGWPRQLSPPLARTETRT